MRAFLGLLLACLPFCIQAQQVFFTSPQSFSSEQRSSFYTSLALHQNLLLFNALDRNLYAYDTKTNQLVWTYPLGQRSNYPPAVVQDKIWVTSQQQVLQLNKQGKLEKKLPIGSLETGPVEREGIIYGTGSVDGGGHLFAYHPKPDSVIWYQDISHGASRSPYYLPNRIIAATSEGNTWTDYAYSGKPIGAICNEKGKPGGTKPCERNFIERTHDGKELHASDLRVKVIKAKRKKMPDPVTEEDYEKYMQHEEELEKENQKIEKENQEGTEDYFNELAWAFKFPEKYYAAEHTVLLVANNLYIIGNNKKLLSKTDLSTFLPQNTAIFEGAPAKLISAANTKVWVLYNHYLLKINYPEAKLSQSIDFRQHKPHQAILEGKNLWLISENDGRLYGITLP